MMREDTFRGFNLIFGNLRDQLVGGKRVNGNLFHHQHQNLPAGCALESQLRFLIPGYAHGISNGGLNQWHKVLKGRDMFKKRVDKMEEEAHEIGDEEAP